MVNIPLPSRALLRLLPFLVSSVVKGGSTSRNERSEPSQGYCPSEVLLGPLRPTPAAGTCPQIIDDETIHQTGNWSPWTYAPTCIPPKIGTGSKLCAYSYDNFRGLSGLGVVATPEIAANAINILEDVDAKWMSQGRGFAVQDKGFQSWAVTEIKGKGRGVVANQTIAQDEVIMTELPLLLRPAALERWEYGAMSKLLANAGNRLPYRDRARIMSMARSRGSNLLDDVLNTNSYRISLGGHDYSGLFPDVARINHACRPNAFIRFAHRTLAMEVVAYREIQVGEELSLSYIPLNLVFEDRQTLLTGWGFQCSCSLCSSPLETKISDRRRQRVEDIMGLLGHTGHRSHKTTSKLVAETFELCELEGMLAQTGDIHHIIALVWERLGDLQLARKHAQLAIEKLRHYAGHDSGRTEQAVQFLKQLG